MLVTDVASTAMVMSRQASVGHHFNPLMTANFKVEN